MVEVVYGSSHFRSLLGILKLGEILSCLIAVCIVASKFHYNYDIVKAFYAGTVIGIILSAVIFGLSSTESAHSLNNSLKLQCFVLAILFLYNIIVSSIFLSDFRGWSAIEAAGAFGLIASFLYLVDSILTFKAYGLRF
ncbi:uncharacterized protein LOC115891545 [Sitophilus oryzae]|uniref:Uncharacterized protein LOC115891545 n=1 Tax=Sitophilus oryzae TaxID=7048 RepID=A0A6J2YYJ0_SITOR|nr:uncharacterized protein LOC115891545 [Sitophilus oryzae]